MSKAFTKEDDQPDVPLERQRIRLAPGEKRYITAEGYAELQREFAALEQKPGTASSVIERLGALLAALTVVPSDEHDPEDGIFFGAWAVLEDETGTKLTYRLVGPDEVDAKAGRISIDSPLGRALLGKTVGDSVEVNLPRGVREYTVSAVRYG